MLARKHDCLAEDPDPKRCMKGHFGKNEKRTSQIKTEHRLASEKARNYKHNLDMLLHLSHECKHLLSMYAFQYSPFPFFITEATQNRRLLHLLLTHREARKWLKRDVLLKILCDIVDALRFFKQKGIVLRNITCFNILVKATRRQQPFLDILPSESFIVKVVDLGQAHHIKDLVYPYPSVLKVAVENQGKIPTRWTPQEALLDGSYSEKSEMYSLGCAGFEMFTHGNQPFSSYDSHCTTEQLLLKLLQEPRTVTLHHWQCIPNDVFNLISRLTDSDIGGRPQSLDAVAQELTSLRTEQNGNEGLKPRVPFCSFAYNF
ncbi:hypothetical protein V1264_024277 [Littorina saxatilis]|uniref:Protein kinase domain-containing protein n=1 Tax=Littorina saxatilis TaxID=31220 RepID=A0AAN9ALX2_9CAEN